MTLSIYVLRHTNGRLYRNDRSSVPALWTSKRVAQRVLRGLDELARDDWRIVELTVDLPEK